MDTPNTISYMYLGYAVFSVIFFGYLLSFYVRYKNLQRDLEVLKELEHAQGDRNSSKPS
jgi:hypothetical protein